MTVEHARSLLPPGDRERVRLAADAAVGDGGPQELEHRYMRAGEVRWADTRLEPLEDERGRYGVRGTLQDITERKLAEQRIHLQAHLLDAVDVAVIAIGLDGLITHWNAGAERMYGWSRDETVGHPLEELVVPPEHEATIKEVMRRVRDTGQWKGELDTRRKDGSVVPSYLEASAFNDLDGCPAGVVGVAVDLTERAETERQVRSARDYLHTITNSMGEGLFTMDTAGRLIYLNRAGERLLGWREDELAGRNMHEATHHRRPDGSDYPIAECPLVAAWRDGGSVRVEEEVFIRKDGTEMPVEIVAEPFETEDGVRGSVVVFGDITERKARERRVRGDMESLAWVGRVRDALAEDRFVLYAQPIVEVATGRTVQHELLLRMLGDDDQPIAPGAFLAAAEEYGLIEEVDRWVVREAIGLAAKGHAVELNLSGRSMSAPRLVDDFRSELDRTGADPALIVVELTETALLEDERAGELFIQRIRALGCRVALDDFGTGYGGFRYLKRLSVDYLKIDIEFVRDLPTNVASQHVVSAVVTLARGFGQKTVAEGVEDEETRAILLDLGVDYAQGYLIARPRPVSEVLGVRP
jgi:PAS domain S-box-containing protein